MVSRLHHGAVYRRCQVQGLVAPFGLTRRTRGATLADQGHAQATKRQRNDEAKEERELQPFVQKCIRDNFAMLSGQEFLQARCDGLTLSERLLRDKRLLKDKSKDVPKFGKLYFTTLRKQYEWLVAGR